MQGPDTQKSNVINLFTARERTTETSKSSSPASSTDEAPKESFQAIMDRNDKNKERLAKERANANKSVLKSYRIKN